MKWGTERLSGGALPKMYGSVDLRGRPVVRIGRADGDDDFLAVVDTGFNGELLVAEEDVERIGGAVSRVAATVELAGGLIHEVVQAKIEIVWMGRSRLVDIFIGIQPTARKSIDEPIALIGTGLLRPHLLLIDFDVGTVEIEGQG
jgi:predicted aspartyl protease